MRQGYAVFTMTNAFSNGTIFTANTVLVPQFRKGQSKNMNINHHRASRRYFRYMKLYSIWIVCTVHHRFQWIIHISFFFWTHYFACFIWANINLVGSNIIDILPIYSINFIQDICMDSCKIYVLSINGRKNK